MNNGRLHAIANWRLPATMDYTGLNFFDQHKIHFDTGSGKEVENLFSGMKNHFDLVEIS